MQTITIQVKESLVSEVISTLEKFKDNVQIIKDKNLELDPFFYERKDKLHDIMNNIEQKSSTLSNIEDFEIKMDKVEQELEHKYAN